ncbi:MAG: SHOCT domain-containing protein [Candidatus Wallbacteria bacterium]|nr:SHOCT domain-containing protein [Candidatus Wallbacteria bacterium]
MKTRAVAVLLLVFLAVWSQGADLEDMLERLKTLHENGMITDSEFDQRRNLLIDVFSGSSRDSSLMSGETRITALPFAGITYEIVVLPFVDRSNQETPITVVQNLVADYIRENQSFSVCPEKFLRDYLMRNRLFSSHFLDPRILAWLAEAFNAHFVVTGTIHGWKAVKSLSLGVNEEHFLGGDRSLQITCDLNIRIWSRSAGAVVFNESRNETRIRRFSGSRDDQESMLIDTGSRCIDNLLQDFIRKMWSY